MPRLRGPSTVVLLLVLAAFALGVLAERWMNGARHEEVLRWYEHAIREYGEAHPAPVTPGTGDVQE